MIQIDSHVKVEPAWLACLRDDKFLRFHSSDQAAFNRKYGKPALFPRPKYWLPFTWKMKQIFQHCKLMIEVDYKKHQSTMVGQRACWCLNDQARHKVNTKRVPLIQNLKTRRDIWNTTNDKIPQPTCFQVRRGPCLG